MERVLRLGLRLLLAVAAAAVLFGAWLLASPTGQAYQNEATSRSPQELIRYLQRRLEGHPNWQRVLLPPLHAAQRHYERELPSGPWPTLAKGQQPEALPDSISGVQRERLVSTPQDIRQALLDVTPGTRILVAPGTYPFEATLRLGHDGTADTPIVLGAARPGTVWLEFAQEEGVLVDRPRWVFENLNIRGTCQRHHDCEHAFHVVGRAAHTVLRNNHIVDFNAHVKVNGVQDQWPDHGLLAFNTLTNTSVRDTDRPVTPFDLVGANHWRVQDNLVSHFNKGEGNQVSFGIFVKGASQGARIERNLVICSLADISGPGIRVGISFGGGGSAPAVCRDRRCDAFEHQLGLAANNVVAHCNDVGLDINRSNQIVLAHNTLINTSGILARGGSEARAKLYGNLYEGVARARNGAVLQSDMDENLPLSGVFMNTDSLHLDWRQPPENIPSLDLVPVDFHGQPREAGTRPGAF